MIVIILNFKWFERNIENESKNISSGFLVGAKRNVKW